MQMITTEDFLTFNNEIKHSDELDYNCVDSCMRPINSSNFEEQINKCLRRILIFVSFVIFSIFPIGAVNIVTYSVSDSLDASSGKLDMQYNRISNEDNRVRISFELINSNTPFTIYNAEWVNGDSVYAPIEPFSLIANTKEVAGKSTVWHITLDFPFSDRFTEKDVLVLNTDKGIVRCPTSRAGELSETIDMLRDDYEKQLEVSEKSSYRARLILAGTLIVVLVVGCFIYVTARRKFIKKRKEIEELSMLISERTDRNKELETKVDALYGSRLDTLNLLCNEYFEKNDSEKVKLTLYNEVEKHILSLRDSKSISELEKIVNTYLDDILIKVKQQLPILSRNDMVFLTYLYAGFSPRAVCIFTDIKIKNFYNRRSRLKERILASDAPDREYFVSKM